MVTHFLNLTHLSQRVLFLCCFHNTFEKSCPTFIQFQKYCSAHAPWRVQKSFELLFNHQPSVYMESSRPQALNAVKRDQFQHCRHVAGISLMPPQPLQTFVSNDLSDTELSFLQTWKKKGTSRLIFTSSNLNAQDVSVLISLWPGSFRKGCPSFGEVGVFIWQHCFIFQIVGKLYPHVRLPILYPL